jgi:hypothetical protein
MLKMLYINYFNIYNIMSYNVNGQNMLNWFYSNFNASNSNKKAPTTNFRINDVDINNNYIGIGTNSNIPVTKLYNINYYISDGRSLGSLFELNLPVFSGTINVDYKIWPPSDSNGLLIQFLNSTTIRFNYTVSCRFLAVAGGGGGGGHRESNAGGGGGGGGVIDGYIVNAVPSNSFTITIGPGGNGGREEGPFGGNGGTDTKIEYGGNSIIAKGGGGGASGKGSSDNRVNASTGGSGAWSNRGTNVGSVTIQNPTNTGVFQNMSVYGYVGSKGGEQNNDSGGGGGGGGAGSPGNNPDGNQVAGNGGNGFQTWFGNVPITVAGGGGGGGRDDGNRTPGSGGSGGGGRGGDSDLTNKDGQPAFTNTGGGGGGGASRGPAKGGNGGSGTVFFYIQPSGVSL